MTQSSLDLVSEVAAGLSPSDEIADWYWKYARDQAPRLATDIDLIPRFRPERILDVGAAPPILVAALQRLGYDATGVDIAPERFEGTGMVKCNIETQDLPFDDGSFDLVCLNEVFEHLRINLLHTCRELVRVVAPGGRLLISTPNARSARGLVNFVARGRSGNIYREYEKLETIGHMGHVREYTLKDVRDLIVRLEMEFEEPVWRGSDPISSTDFRRWRSPP